MKDILPQDSPEAITQKEPSEIEELSEQFSLTGEQIQERLKYWRATATGDAVSRMARQHYLLSLPQEEFERLEEELGLRKSEATMAAPETAEEPAPRPDERREPETASEEPKRVEEVVPQVPATPAPAPEPEPSAEPPPAHRPKTERFIQKSPERREILATYFPDGWNRGWLKELQKAHPEVYRKLASAEHWDEQSQETKDTLAGSFSKFLQQYPERAARVSEGSPYIFSLELTEEARTSQERGEPIFLSGITTSSNNSNTLRITLDSFDLIRGLLGGAQPSTFIGHAVWVLRSIRRNSPA